MSGITSTFISELGNWTLNIDDGDFSANCHILNIGNIKYDFDIVSAEQSSTSKAMLYNAIDFTLYKYDNFGNNVYSRLAFNLASANAIVTLTGEIFRTGETWIFKFLLNSSGLSFDSKSSKLKCKTITYSDLTVTVADVYSTLTPVASMKIGASFYDAYTVGAWIKEALTYLNLGLSKVVTNFADTNNVLYTNEFYEDGSLSIYDTKIGLAIVDYSTTGTISALTTLSKLALLEGGFFGTGFDANFYINRTKAGTAITIDKNSVIELNEVSRLPVFGELRLTVAAHLGIYSGSATQTYSSNLNKSLILNVNVPPLMKGTKDTTYIDNNYIIGPDIEPDLAASGIQGIKESFPAESTNVISIELRDCSVLKIYDSFTFTDVSEIVDGNTYRVSYAEYDLIKNSVKIKAYQI